MNTGTYYRSDDILSAVLPRVNDLEYHAMPKGFYISMIQKALEELGMDTFFDEKRESFQFPIETLTLSLPKGCFNVRNVYLFNGDECNIANSIKVYWKRNYFTKGNGFIANDKFNNDLDPFLTDHFGTSFRVNKNLIRYNTQISARFYYNIQVGNIMFSSYCRGIANKVMIHYNGTGCDIGDAPIIPVFLRSAIEDYVTVKALEVFTAKDPTNRNWMALLAMYKQQLMEPFTGSWEKAEYRVKTLNTSQREEMMTYLGRGNWAEGA